MFLFYSFRSYDWASPGPFVDAIAATASRRDLTSSARVVPRPAAVNLNTANILFHTLRIAARCGPVERRRRGML